MKKQQTLVEKIMDEKKIIILSRLRNNMCESSQPLLFNFMTTIPSSILTFYKSSHIISQPKIQRCD